MHGILIIAHAPLASALKSVARHTFPESVNALEALDVAPDMPLEDIDACARELLDRVRMRNPQALILTDVFGATPYNVAFRLADGVDVRLLVGVNVPMLWRSLSYANETLEAMASRAEAGAVQGVMQVASSRPQSQTSRPAAYDHENDHHQQ
jgi:PTS system mannose-specific IIA component